MSDIAPSPEQYGTPVDPPSASSAISLTANSPSHDQPDINQPDEQSPFELWLPMQNHNLYKPYAYFQSYFFPLNLDQQNKC